MSNKVRVIGGGLAGCEAAWQCAENGVKVKLCEMKPDKFTPAHKNPDFAELICSEGISEKVFALRFDALKMLQGLIHHYDERGYSDTLLNGIAEKKGAMIMSASSKTEMDKILKPKAPHFDGVRFIADRYLLPEEELICWSEASLRAPLNEYAFRRYMELFCRMFPEESEALHIA